MNAGISKKRKSTRIAIFTFYTFKFGNLINFSLKLNIGS